MAIIDITSQEGIQLVWEKGRIIDGYNPNLFRKDSCGAWIYREAYANTYSKFGWEIDHIYPVSKGGNNEQDNLRPLQWENNRSKGDDFPVYTAAVVANGLENADIEKQLKVNNATLDSIRNIYRLQ